MNRYYISNPEAERGFEELTESEWISLIGEGENRTYANQVYRGEISIDDVPEELCEAVQAIVDAKIERFGEYMERDISASELKSMIEGVL